MRPGKNMTKIVPIKTKKPLTFDDVPDGAILVKTDPNHGPLMWIKITVFQNFNAVRLDKGTFGLFDGDETIDRIVSELKEV